MLFALNKVFHVLPDSNAVYRHQIEQVKTPPYRDCRQTFFPVFYSTTHLPVFYSVRFYYVVWTFKIQVLLIKQSQEQAFGNLLKIGEKVCTDKDFIYRIEIEKNAA